MTTTTPTLASFLLREIAADEAVAREAKADGAAAGIFIAAGDAVPHIARHGPARVLAQCAAHRRIVERASDPYESDEAGTGREVLRLLGGIYADRPGFREEWAL